MGLVGDTKKRSEARKARRASDPSIDSSGRKKDVDMSSIGKSSSSGSSGGSSSVEPTLSAAEVTQLRGVAAREGAAEAAKQAAILKEQKRQATVSVLRDMDDSGQKVKVQFPAEYYKQLTKQEREEAIKQTIEQVKQERAAAPSFQAAARPISQKSIRSEQQRKDLLSQERSPQRVLKRIDTFGAREQEQTFTEAKSVPAYTTKQEKEYFKQTPFKKTVYQDIQETRSPYFTEEEEGGFFSRKIIQPIVKSPAYQPIRRTISKAGSVLGSANVRIYKGEAPLSDAPIGNLTIEKIEPYLEKSASTVLKYTPNPWSIVYGVRAAKAKYDQSQVDKAIAGKIPATAEITAAAIETQSKFKAFDKEFYPAAGAALVRPLTRNVATNLAILTGEAALGFTAIRTAKYLTKGSPSLIKSATVSATRGAGTVAGVGLTGLYAFSKYQEIKQADTVYDKTYAATSTVPDILLAAPLFRSKSIARAADEVDTFQTLGRKPKDSAERIVWNQKDIIRQEADELANLELSGARKATRVDFEDVLPVKTAKERMVAKEFQAFVEKEDLTIFGSTTIGKGADIEVAITPSTTTPVKAVKRAVRAETPQTLAFKFVEQVKAKGVDVKTTQFATGQQVDIEFGEFKGTITQQRYLSTGAGAFVGGLRTQRTVPSIYELSSYPISQRIPTQSQRLLSQQYLSKFQGVVRGRAKDLPSLYQTREFVLQELAGAGLPKSPIYKKRLKKLQDEPPIFELPRAKTAGADIGEAIDDTTPLGKFIETRQRTKYSERLAKSEPSLLKAEAFVKGIPEKLKGLKQLSPLSKLESGITYEGVLQKYKFLERGGESIPIRPYATPEKVGVLIPSIKTTLPISEVIDKPQFTGTTVTRKLVKPEPRPTPKRPYRPLKRRPSPLYAPVSLDAAKPISPAYGRGKATKAYSVPSSQPYQGFPSPAYPIGRQPAAPPSKPYTTTTLTPRVYTAVTTTPYLGRRPYQPYSPTTRTGVGFPLTALPLRGKGKRFAPEKKKFKQPKRYTPTLRAAVGGIKRRKGKKMKLTGLEERPILF